MAAPKPLPLEQLPADVAALIRRDGDACVWCSRRLGLEPGDATREHVIPRSQGGKDMLDNYLLACAGCNRARRSRAPLSWLAKCERRGLKAQRALVESALARAQAAGAVKPSRLSRPKRRARAR